MNSPLIFTTPRTGSELLCKIVSNYAEQYLNYGPNLSEFFTITRRWQFDIKHKNGYIYITDQRISNPSTIPLTEEFRINERKKRIELIKNNPRQLIKLLPYDIDENTLEFAKKNYDIIFLERRDKFSQFISFLNLMSSNVAHHTSESEPITSIIYEREYLYIFLQGLETYSKVKKLLCNQNSITLYYEDFIVKDNIEKYCLDTIGYSTDENFKSVTINTIPTPYLKNARELIKNKVLWENDMDLILNSLNKYCF